MIVSCPACGARYKFDEAKLKGRSAKISCPRCKHSFVVRPPQAVDSPIDPGLSGADKMAASEPDIFTIDFRKLGITWRVRKGIGLVQEFHSLGMLHDLLEGGQVDLRDAISFDQRQWRPLDTIDDLEAYFQDVLERAERGELTPVDAFEEDEEDDEDMADAPTTIVRHGSSVADEIRAAIEEASTPAPAPRRGETPEPVVRAEKVEPEAAAPAAAPGPSSPAPDPFKQLADKTRAEVARKQSASRGAMVVIALAVFVAIAALYAAWAMGLFGGRTPPAPEPPPVPVLAPEPEPTIEEPEPVPAPDPDPEPAPAPVKPAPAPVKPAPVPVRPAPAPVRPAPAPVQPAPAPAAPAPAPVVPAPVAPAPEPLPAPEPAMEVVPGPRPGTLVLTPQPDPEPAPAPAPAPDPVPDPAPAPDPAPEGGAP